MLAIVFTLLVFVSLNEIPSCHVSQVATRLDKQKTQTTRINVPEVGKNKDEQEVIKALINNLDCETARQSLHFKRALFCILAFDDGKNAVPLLVAELGSENYERAWAAAHALANIGPAAKDAVPAIVKILNTREGVAIGPPLYALGGIGPHAKPAASRVEKLLEHSNISVRANASWAWWRIGGDPKRSVKVVKQILRETHTEDERDPWFVLWVAGELGPVAKESVPLIRSYLDHSDFSLRSEAACALVRIDPTEKNAIERVLKLLRSIDTPAYVKLDAMRSLQGVAEHKKECVAMCKAMLTDKDHRSCFSALLALDCLEITIEERISFLKTGLRDKHDLSRQFAAYELGRLGARAKSALPELEKLEDDEDYYIRMQVNAAIKRIRASGR
jgi:HEAT repeat protein